jgi:hypothetical protein
MYSTLVPCESILPDVVGIAFQQVIGMVRPPMTQRGLGPLFFTLFLFYVSFLLRLFASKLQVLFVSKAFTGKVFQVDNIRPSTIFQLSIAKDSQKV